MPENVKDKISDLVKKLKAYEEGEKLGGSKRKPEESESEDKANTKRRETTKK